MKYAISTLGCKANQFESGALEKALNSCGFERTEGGDADVVIVNTCAVTAESERKSRQAVRKIMKANPGALCAVCGCCSQVNPDSMAELGASVIYGTGNKTEFLQSILHLVSSGETCRKIDDPFRRLTFERLVPTAFEGRTRAYVKIQDGCDNFCTYCIIPYARGRVRSLPAEEIGAQCALLVKEGFTEIVLTGIEIASYGKDLKPRSTLADGVCAASASSAGARIRLGSLEPTCITEEFCRKLLDAGNMCSHFHLSLQSGSDGVLSRMHRKYNTEQFYRATELLRAYFPGCGLTADLITGFPGETDAEFEETLSFIRKCAFSSMHVFPYSERPGTPAASMVGMLPKALREERASAAIAAASEMKEKFLASRVGKTEQVIFETCRDGVWQGHSSAYSEVVTSDEAVRGKICRVKIISSDREKLMGNIVKDD